MKRLLLQCPVAHVAAVAAAVNTAALLGQSGVVFNTRDFVDEAGDPVAVAEVAVSNTLAAKVALAALGDEALSVVELEPGEESPGWLRRAPWPGL